MRPIAAIDRLDVDAIGSAQHVEQRLGFFEIGGVGALSEPKVDRRE
jgi:hypothetical protein